MSTNLDAHGQPLVSEYNASSRINRGIHELIGFLRGIVADNYISEKESDALGMWLVANRELAEHWPVRTLAQRIERIYADGHADEEERAELAELVRDIVGRQDDVTLMMSPTDLPLTRPAPDVIFDSNEFVLTGRFSVRAEEGVPAGNRITWRTLLRHRTTSNGISRRWLSD